MSKRDFPKYFPKSYRPKLYNYCFCQKKKKNTSHFEITHSNTSKGQTLMRISMSSAIPMNPHQQGYCKALLRDKGTALWEQQTRRMPVSTHTHTRFPRPLCNILERVLQGLLTPADTVNLRADGTAGKEPAKTCFRGLDYSVIVLQNCGDSSGHPQGSGLTAAI